jgi:hypothetical protein
MNKQVFNGIVDICKTHAGRLHWAMTEFSYKRPINAAIIRDLTDMDLAVFDQFIARFSKLQDAMGSKLLPAVIELTHEEG